MCLFLESCFLPLETVKFHLNWTTICNSSLVVWNMVLGCRTSTTQGSILSTRMYVCMGCTLIGKLSKTWGWESVGSGLCLLQLSGVWFIKATVTQRRKVEGKTLVAFPIRLTCPEEGTLDLRHTVMWVSHMHLLLFLSVPLCFGHWKAHSFEGP